MKKLILFLAAVCYTAMMQAEIVNNVPYIDENGVEQICEKATVVPTLSGKVRWTEGWYLVKSTQTAGRFSIECVGAVHLILGDGNTLEQVTTSELNTSHLAGIKVSGGSSLTIYGQKNQTGLLIARGGEWAAAIGGGDNDNGNNITINSGRVKAYGGNSAAAIGGGLHGSASNITINGGAVIAMSVGGSTSAIGSGSAATFNGAVSSNIFIADRVKAMVSSSISNDISITSNSRYRDLIEHSSIEDDIADDIAGMCQFASIDFTPFFAALDKAAEDVQDDYLLQFVNAEKQKMVESKKIITYEEAVAARDLSKSRIKAAKKLVPYLPDDENIIQKEYIYSLFDAFGSLDDASEINNKMYEGIGQLQGLTAGYNWGKADALGPLGTKQNGPALIVTDKDDKEIILYSPKSVEYIKVNEE